MKKKIFQKERKARWGKYKYILWIIEKHDKNIPFMQICVLKL